MAKQTRLEATGIEERNRELMRNDYERNDPYSSKHEDALSHDDENHPLGKGTGLGGHTHYLPDPNASKTTPNYSNFDTFNGGGSYDKYGRNGVGGRERLQMINIYGPDNQYGKDSVEVDLNIIDQYVTN